MIYGVKGPRGRRVQGSGFYSMPDKMKAFEPVPFSADCTVFRSYKPATILSLSVTVSLYSISSRPSNLTDVFYF